MNTTTLKFMHPPSHCPYLPRRIEDGVLKLMIERTKDK